MCFKHLIVVLLFVLVMTPICLWAETKPKKTTGPSYEDISTCKLPNAKMILPGQGHRLAVKQGGTVFSFATRTFTPQPDFKEAEFTVAKFIAALKGDIYYAVPENGCFMVTSGRIVDLGKHYLHELSGKKLARPKVLTTKEAGQDVPGLLAGIQDLTGHCVLLETKAGKAVLLRIVSQNRQRGEVVVQWVYQPDGSRRFTIPKGAIIKDRLADGENRVSGSSVQVDIPQLNIRQFAKAYQAHLANRKKLIHISVELISSKKAELSNRYIAVNLLGKIHAVEAVAILASYVDENLALRSTRITVQNSYRCVGTLIKIGIPGAHAALRQIEADAQLEEPKDEGRQRLWNDRVVLRRNLLALVILKVYGEKLARIVIEDRMKETSAPKVKEAYRKTLEAFPRIKNWLPEEKPAAIAPTTITMPTK